MKKNFKTFTAVPAGMRATIQVAELQDKIRNPETPESERLKLTQQILVIVTGGAYDPADERYDIEISHARELISSFLGM